MWRSDVDTKKGSFIIELRGDFTGFLRGYDVRMNADEFHTFQSRPHVNRIYFVEMGDWDDALIGIAVRRKGTWHYEYEPGTKYNLDTQEKDITFDLITYLDTAICWFKRLPVLYKVEGTADQFQSNRYSFVLFRQHFRQELFTRLLQLNNRIDKSQFRGVFDAYLPTVGKPRPISPYVVVVRDSNYAMVSR